MNPLKSLSQYFDPLLPKNRRTRWEMLLLPILLIVLIWLSEGAGILIPASSALLYISILLTASIGGLYPGVVGSILISIYVMYAVAEGHQFVAPRTSDFSKIPGIFLLNITAIFFGYTWDRVRGGLGEGASLAETHARLAATLNALPDLLFEVDRQGTIYQFHAPNPELLYLPPSEFLMKKMTDVLPSEAGMIVMEAIEESIKTGRSVSKAYSLDMPEGEMWYEISSAAKHGQEERAIFLVRDITERRKAEEALRQNEVRYRGIVEDQTELICRFAPGNILTFGNAAYCRYFDINQDDLVGSHFTLEVTESDQKYVLEQFRLLSPENPVITYEHRLNRGKSKNHWINWTVRAFFDAEGNIIEYQGVGQDITKRKDAEFSVREKDALYRGIVEDQSELICRFLPDDTLTFVNAAYCRYFDMEQDELIGTSLMSLIPEADLAYARMLFKSLSPENPLVSHEHRIILPGNKVRWQSWTDRAFFNADGNIIEYQGVGRDITKSKEIEQALQAEIAARSALEENAIDGMITINERGLIQRVNPATERLFGYSAEELSGQNIKILMPEPYHGEHDEYIDNYLTTNKPMIIGIGREVRGQRKNGSTFPMELAVSETKVGGQHLFNGVIRDITERHWARTALREREAQYRAIVEDQTELICRFLPDKTLTFVNGAYCRYFDKKRNDLIGSYFVPEIPESDQAYAAERFKSLNSKNSVVTYEHQSIRRKGEICWQRWTVRAFFNEAEELIEYQAVGRDITGRKVNEQALQSEVAARDALENNAVDGMITANARGVIERVNPATEKLFGYPPDELIGQSINTLMDTPDSSNHDNYIKNYTSTGEAHIIGFGREVKGKRKDGSVFPLDLTISETKAGGRHLFHGIARDMTEQRQAEKALRQSEAQYRGIVEDQTELIYRFLPDGTYTFANDAYYRYFGLDRDQLIGTIYTPLIPKEEWEEIEGIFHLLRPANPFIRYEHHVTLNDGLTRWQQWTTRAFFDTDGNIIEFQSVGQDITNRKRAEESLRAKDKLYQTLIHNLPDAAVLLFERNFRYSIAGGPVLDILGVTPEMIEGKMINEVVLQEQSKDMTPIYGQAFEGKRVVTEHYLDGRTYLSHVQPIYDEHDEITSGMVLLLDITKRKQAETELQRAKEAAEQSNRSKTEFLANMSHEIRTPMNGVLGLIELTLGTTLTADQRQLLEESYASAEVLLKLLDQILDLSKIEVGRLELESIPFNLREIVAQPIATLTPSVLDKNLRIVSQISEDVPTILSGDPTRLQQVLLNLLSNGIKFTEEGEVTLKVGLDKQVEDQIKLLFSVHDTGIGIPPKKQDLIFNAFTQADGSTTRRYGGTGLGLTISHRLVEHFGGELRVDSEAEKGSTFSFTADFAATDQQPKSKKILPVFAPIEHLENLSILLVEDSTVNQKVITRMLEKTNWTVEIAQNGLIALDMIKQGDFDLILMDVQMPELDGFEATRSIREKEQREGGHIMIIGLTAHVMPRDRQRCLDAGMDDYLPKPVRAAALYEMIGKTMGIDLTDSQSKNGVVIDTDTSTDTSDEVIRDAMDIIEALVYCDNSLDLLRDIIGTFQSLWPDTIRNIEAAVKTQNDQELKQWAHLLKGQSATLAAGEMRDVAWQLEEAANNNQFDGTLEMYAHLLKTKERLWAYFKEKELS